MSRPGTPVRVASIAVSTPGEAGNVSVPDAEHSPSVTPEESGNVSVSEAEQEPKQEPKHELEPEPESEPVVCPICKTVTYVEISAENAHFSPH